MKRTWRMSEKEFEETFPNHNKKWTKEEEREVLEELRQMDATENHSTIYTIINALARKVGRTPGALGARFGYPRLRVEWLFGLLDRGKFVTFLRHVMPNSNYAKRREIKRQLIKREEILGQKIYPQKVKDILKGKDRKWKMHYDPYNLLIDEEEE